MNLDLNDPDQRPARRRSDLPLLLTASLLAGTAALLLAHYQRHYPWLLAAVLAFAVAVFVAAALRTSARLRALWRSPGPPPGS
jgi:hypothetical protein